MPLTVIDSIPFLPDADKMAEKLKLGGMQSHEQEVKKLVELGARMGLREPVTQCTMWRKQATPRWLSQASVSKAASFG